MTHAPLFPDNRNVVLTNYGRTAFEKILQLRNLSGGTIVLPALLCRDGFEDILVEYELDPVFVDVDSETYHMDFDATRRVAPDADAVVLPHTFGVPADGNRWQDLSKEFDVTLIEDCARALGATVRGRPVGGFGEFAIYSLRKVSPALGGGALAGTLDPSEIDLDPPTYDVKDAYPLVPNRYKDGVERVYEYLTTLHATPERETDGGRSSVRPRELDGINAFVFCYHLTYRYRDRLATNAAAARRVRSSLEPLGFEFQATRGRCPFHFIAMTVPANRDELLDRLRNAEIEARHFWDPPLVTSFVEERELSEYPNTKAVIDHGLQLPLVEMTEGDVSRAIEIAREVTPTVARR